LRGVNDTTNSALKTGLAISGGRAPQRKGVTCVMHAQELVVTHALGLRTRSRKGEVIDEFPTGKLLRDKTKQLLSKIMDKKAKGRFIKYKDYCRDNLGIEARKLELPNDTRVSGVFAMYESALKSRKCINMFCNNGVDQSLYRELMLNDLDWIRMSETYSILKITNELSKYSQEDNVDANCFSYYHVASAKYYITQLKSIKVFDLSAHWTADIDVTKIPQIQKTRDELNEETKKLIDRFKIEFDKYFPRPDSDQLLMMLFHPVMVWAGFK
jgi:hypothetical protein